MEQGNEGDEIILLALKQIECTCLDEIKSIGQLGPGPLVEIVARSLWFISQGEVKFPIALPTNIASKHRICTNMATKIKEMGYLGDCGYNQLLYPVDTQTRALLNWLVQKLPRTEDSAAEDVVGGNALLNKRIMESIAVWKTAPWRLHLCAKGNKNLYFQRPAVTSASSEVLGMYSSLPSTSGSMTTSIFERHAHLLSRDAEYAKRLESNFSEETSNATGSGAAVTHLVNAAFALVKQQTRLVPSTSSLVGGPKSVLGTATSDSRESTLVTKTLQELISDMSSDKDDTGSKLDVRGTRFTHTTEFSQEKTASLLVAGSDSPLKVGSQGGGAKFKPLRTLATDTGEDEEDLGPLEVRSSSLAAIARNRAEQRKQQQEEEDRKRQQEVEEARDLVARAEVTVEELERYQNNTSSKTRQLENELSTLQQLGEKLEREIILKRKTLEMLPSAGDNIAKLQAICANSAKRLMQLAQEWETHRRPLLESLRDIKSSKTKRKALCKKMIEDMKRCREEMVAMMQELKDKQEKSQALMEEVAKLPRNINRTMYTYRIMDIIASIAKQNKDIAKITADIRDVQKTINMNTNILSRADAVAEDKIYSAANSANRSVGMVDAYRNLTSLRGNFELLIDTVNKIGQFDMQARDLETKIDQEVARVSANNFDRIKADLEEIQRENQRLIAAIKAARGNR